MCFGSTPKPPEAPKAPPAPEPTQEALGTKSSVRKRRRRAAVLGTEQLRIPTSSDGPLSL